MSRCALGAAVLALALEAGAAWALTCASPKTQLTAQQQLVGVVTGVGEPYDFSLDGLVNVGDAVVLLGGVADPLSLPDCSGVIGDFRFLDDRCLNVALGESLSGVQLADKLAPAGDEVEMLLVHNRTNDPFAYPDGFTTSPSASGKGVDVDWTPTDAQVGDYEFLVVGNNATNPGDTAINLVYLKVVDDPAPAPFPAATRPFLLGQSLAPGAWNGLSFPADGSLAVFPAGAAVTNQVIGAADLVLMQIFPEWGLPPYPILDGSTKLTVDSVRAAGGDVMIAVDIFGSAFRNQVGGAIPDELYTACGIDPEADPLPPIRFSCAELRERLGDYVEALAEALHPPYLVLGVEVDLYRSTQNADYPNFATAYRDAYDRVKAVSPGTKVFTSIQYEAMLVFGTLVRLPGFSAEQQIRQNITDLFAPLAGKNDLFGVTTFPEIVRAAELKWDDGSNSPFPAVNTPIAEFRAPEEIPEDYYRYVTERLGAEGFPARAAIVETGWSSVDVDEYKDSCETLAFYPVDLAAVNNYADDLTDADVDPTKRPHRSQDAQARFLHRMMEIMYGVVEPEVYTWFYGRDPTAPGTAVIFPTFQTMGLREDLFAFDGMCDAGSPQSPENRAKASATGDVSKAAYCDWLRLNDLPYAPPSD